MPRTPKKPTLAATVTKLAQRVDTIESNAARDTHDGAAAVNAALTDISGRIDRIGRDIDGGFKLIGDHLMQNQQRLEQRLDAAESRQADFERTTNQRLTALEARKESR
jgi:hypothetical protein